MAQSVSPLGSLSSPSPSPPPNPIDESELSELTDDDHNDEPPQRQHRTRRPPARAPTSSRRKKRGGLVPAPMWGWAYKNDATLNNTTPGPSRPDPPQPKSHSTTPDAEEEEEEELPTPPRAMEEEEAEDPAPPRRKKVVLPKNFDPNNPPPLPRSKRGGRAPYPQNTRAAHNRLLVNMWKEGYKIYDPNAPTSDEEDDHTQDQDPPSSPAEDDQNTEPPKDPSPPPKPKSRRKKVVLPRNFDPNNPPPLPRSKRGGRAPYPQNTRAAHNRLLVSMWKEGYKIYDPNAPTSDEEDDQGSTSDDTTSHSDASDSDKQDQMDIDDDPRQSPVRPALDPNLKSISAVDPPADSQSLPLSVRASLDPTVSPPDESLSARPIQDDDLEQDQDPGSPDDDDHHPPPDPDMELDPDEDEDIHPAEPSQPPSPTPLVEPEPEQEDEDPDLQPAHRAEALDVLATIELKFALLRERLYVEKMEGLAWEEALVCDGSHPELHHLQSELTKRRDKRLMLASKKRTYEIDAISRRTRGEETWCWEGWDIARIELQTEMIAETNRKRRKLERERRTIERPPGARRIPTAILNPPPPPTLRQIANTFPLPCHHSHLAANKRTYGKGLGIYPGLDGGPSAYPDLASLSPHEIAADIEFLFQHRRLGYGFGMGFAPPMGVPMGVGYNGTPPAFGPAAVAFGPNPTPAFGVHGLGIGESYPPNSVPSGGGVGPPPAGSGPGLDPPAPAPSTVPSQNAPGRAPGIANADGPSFSQPTMGVFQAPPSIGTGSAGYPVGSGASGTSIVIGPGGTTSTPVMGPGGTRIQRPSGFVERERELQRDRDMRERELTPRDRELATQREREIRDREREREFGPSIGPGYPAWNSKLAGGMDWEARHREERERNERDRERERSQAQPIVPTPAHRHLHPHSHAHQHPPQPPHQPHPVRAHQSHHHLSHQHAQHQHATSHAPPHHHVGQHHHHRHHHHVVHHHHSSGANSSGPDGASPHLQASGSAPGVQMMEIINLSANTSSKPHWARDEGKLGGASMPGSRPPSTHPLPAHGYDERGDRPVATPFVLAPSHHTSPPRHGWTPGPDAAYPERFHTPVPHRFPNGRPLTTSPPRAPVSSPGFVRKASPGLKLGMGYSPRLVGPGVTPSGILTSGPGVPPGPGIAPAPSVEYAGRASPLMGYAGKE